MQTKTQNFSVPKFCGTEIFIYLEENIMGNWTANYVIYETIKKFVKEGDV